MVARLVGLGLLLVWLGRQRLQEVRRSQRNRSSLRARGAVEVGPSFSGVLAVLHGGWFVSLFLEAVLFRPQPPGWIVGLGLGLALSGQALRQWALQALGDRWVMVNLVVPGEQRIQLGPYRWLRHPNYLGVALELSGIPLIWGSYCTTSWSVPAYLWVWRKRINFEEKALLEHTQR